MYTLDITVQDVKFAVDFDYQAFTETAFLRFLGIWHRGEKVGHLLGYNSVQTIAAEVGKEMRANPPSPEKVAENEKEMQEYRNSSDMYAQAVKMAAMTPEDREMDALKYEVLNMLGLGDGKSGIAMTQVEIPDDGSAPFPIH